MAAKKPAAKKPAAKKPAAKKPAAKKPAVLQRKNQQLNLIHQTVQLLSKMKSLSHS